MKDTQNVLDFNAFMEFFTARLEVYCIKCAGKKIYQLRGRLSEVLN